MNKPYSDSKGLHLNYSLITEMINNGASVLDLGCGDGTLLKNLINKKNVKGKGIEINQDNVIKSIQKGLSIIQGDIDAGLKDFADKEWDYVILNQTLQSTEKPDYVIDEMLRVGKKVVVSFPNFAYWKVRFYLFFNGKMPKSKMLPFEWFDTPNIHLLTINDFYEFCHKRDIKIEQTITMTRGKRHKSVLKKWWVPFFAEEVIFVISR
ncbi:MAG: methionine biosynthesis protein MetW [Candidatus Gastranaerophilales bacterium]|nr:methionine biosynthesis protein MetW [Candidatus Gastranaerophilales bacterium]